MSTLIRILTLEAHHCNKTYNEIKFLIYPVKDILWNSALIKELYKMNENKGTEIERFSKAENILPQINSKTKLGDLRKIAKDIKKITN